MVLNKSVIDKIAAKLVQNNCPLNALIVCLVTKF